MRRRNNILKRMQFTSSFYSMYFWSTLHQLRSTWQSWFDDMWQNRNNPNYQSHWRADFRMSGYSFENLVNLVRPRLEERDTNLRRAIPIEKRVAIALWRLSTGNSFRTVSKTLAVGKSTAVTITREFCAEMKRQSASLIKFPKTRMEVAEAIENFKVDVNCKLPQVVGAIDGTHVPILAPTNDRKYDYFSRKQHYTINTQAGDW